MRVGKRQILAFLIIKNTDRKKNLECVDIPLRILLSSSHLAVQC